MISRRGILAGVALLAAVRPARALQDRYVFDGSAGRIGFTAHHMGMLTSSGRCRGFAAEVVLDQTDPTRASVDVTVQTGSIDLPFPGAEEMLRSEAYFDVTRYPVARFRGMALGAGESGSFPLQGDLTVRGVTRPFAMAARLTDRARGADGRDVANFAASGVLSRSAFGMTADRLFIGDEVEIGVEVRLVLA